MNARTSHHEREAAALLRRAAYPALRLLSCQFQQQRLVVVGSVPSFT